MSQPFLLRKLHILGLLMHWPKNTLLTVAVALVVAVVFALSVLIRDAVVVGIAALLGHAVDNIRNEPPSTLPFEDRPWEGASLHLKP